MAPGTVIKANEEGLQVATGKGVLNLLKIQCAGGRVISATDFIHAQQKNLLPHHAFFARREFDDG